MTVRQLPVAVVLVTAFCVGADGEEEYDPNQVPASQIAERVDTIAVLPALLSSEAIHPEATAARFEALVVEELRRKGHRVVDSTTWRRTWVPLSKLLGGVFDPVTGGIELVENPIPAGWTLTNIDCQSTGSGGSSFVYLGASESPTDDFEPGDDTVQVTIGDGDDVLCICTNTDEIGGGCDVAAAGFGGPARGCIEICKVTTPTANADVDFEFTGLGGFTINPFESATDCFVNFEVPTIFFLTVSSATNRYWRSYGFFVAPEKLFAASSSVSSSASFLSGRFIVLSIAAKRARPLRSARRASRITYMTVLRHKAS